MRLTLRNLLAYMDGNLRPDDSEAIGKRIEESKFATDLYHKIRDVMRRIRLAAPSVNERSTSFDCNTVAEYLDNALPSENVVEFEEACLKSDMHLAEVASSHQILTVVQVEPAEIDPESRLRMYQLTKVAQQADEERLAASEAATFISGDNTAQQGGARSRPKPVVPEYLREPRRKPRLLLSAAVVFLFSAALGLVLMAFGQFHADKPLGRLLAQGQAAFSGHKPTANPSLGGGTTPGKLADTASALPSAAAAAGTAVQPAAGNPKPTASASLLPGKSSESPVIVATTVGAGSKGSGSELPLLQGPGNAPSPAAMKPTAGTAASAPATVASVAGSGVKALPTPPPAVEKNSPMAPLPPSGPGNAIVSEPPNLDRTLGGEKKPAGESLGAQDAPLPPPLPKPPEVASAVGPAKRPAAGNAATPDPTTPDAAAPAPADRAPQVGKFMSDGQDVLLKREAATLTWRRVVPEEFLPAGQSLIALPCYRPRVVLLNVGAILEMLSGTKLDLAPPNAQGVPGANIDYGRVVLKPLAQAGPNVRITLGGHSGTLTLVNVDSVAGLEMARIHAAGTDPEKVMSHPRSTLFVAKGSVIWDEGQGKQPARLTAPMVWPLDAPTSQPGDSRSTIPEWVMNNTTSDLDQRAALAVAQSLPADRPAPLVLMELTDHPRKENRWLAVRCLSHLDRFEPMVAALNDANYRTEWPDYIDQLREAITRGPETAAAIRAALDTKFGSDAPALYRMLWGYTDNELGSEEDARLVKYLDHESLVFRVLAFVNLNEITKQGFLYRPEQLPGKRAAAVLRWKQQLAAGKIRFKGSDKSKEAAGNETSPPGSHPQPGSAQPMPVAPSPDAVAPANPPTDESPSDQPGESSTDKPGLPIAPQP